MRLTIGVAQGMGIYALFEHGEALSPVLRFALLFLLVFVPAIPLVGLGAMGRVALPVWTGAAALGALGIGAWAGYRTNDEPEFYSIPLFALVAFIAHHLVQVGAEARSWRGPYPRYFDLAWRHGVQAALAGGFLLAFWLLLLLGAALFGLVGFEGFRKLIEHEAFICIASATVFALAVHLTIERAGLVIGARTLALTLLAWLLPMITAIVGVFVALLPFAGLDSVDGVSAGGLMLSAATALILLLNAAFQAGETPPNPVLRWSGLAAAFLLAPIALLAIYAIALRVGEYGLTPSRVVAAAGAAVVMVHAVGAGAAAILSLRGGAWMAGLGTSNVVAAFASAAVISALLTPLGDPARIAVEDQMRRLERGAVAPEEFDLRMLAHSGARWGREAIDTLANRPDALGEQARALRESDYRDLPPEPTPQPSVEELRAAIQTAPGEPPIPEAFFTSAALNEAIQANALRCTLSEENGENPCQAFWIDVTGDGEPELGIQGGAYDITIFQIDQSDDWRWVATGPFCCVRLNLPVTAEPRPFYDLLQGERRIILEPRGSEPAPLEPTPPSRR